VRPKASSVGLNNCQSSRNHQYYHRQSWHITLAHTSSYDVTFLTTQQIPAASDDRCGRSPAIRRDE